LKYIEVSKAKITTKIITCKGYILDIQKTIKEFGMGFGRFERAYTKKDV